jgi:UDP-N-acetylglucosamine 2-epimerase (non-hydrolysing)
VPRQATENPAKIVHVVGARPNFVKIAPVITALEDAPVQQLIVHTGQHYDARMSHEMLVDLEFPAPDVFLGVGSGSHAAQTARAMIALEEVLQVQRPEVVCVGGDVNSTLATALVCAKVGIPVAHIESGLRSFDWTMPEEINRVLTDRLSSLLFIHSPEARDNLLREGIGPERIHDVGNTMIDSLRRFEHKARSRHAWQGLGLAQRGYVLVTLHRPSNVDVEAQLGRIVDALGELVRRHQVVFPIHPRTRARLAEWGQLAALEAAGVLCLEPVGYLDFLSLEQEAGAIITDSGGIQEEASALGVPCYTLRPNTERPITVSAGTNTLLGDDPERLRAVQPLDGEPRAAEIPLWDGNSGERVAAVLLAQVMRGPARRRAAVPQDRKLEAGLL